MNTKAKKINQAHLTLTAFTLLLGSFSTSHAFALGPTGSGVDGCADHIGSCDYYLCRETLQPCGEDGYFLHFAYHYCTTLFAKASPRMSSPGQAWMTKAASCLQRKVEEISPATSCEETADQAIASHPACYVSNGFCKLGISDQVDIAETIWRSLDDLRIDHAMIDIVGLCAEQKI